ncbi:MAG: ImmA/IrrE family metallo-endopeptidase [Candidatus Zixiibacteriota bacterium]
MRNPMPINLDILKWARISLGLSVSEVAKRMKKRKSEIEDWESGISFPTYSQLEKLAYEVYKRPIALFFFPEIPEEDTPKTEFRTLPDTLIEDLPVEIIKVYRKAKVYQLYLAELYDNSKPVSTNLIDKYSIRNRNDVFSIASDIRINLGISIEEQYAWDNFDTAFKKWRIALEEKGIFVFKDAFKNDDFSGFCVYDKKYPIIFINNSMPYSRQIFTLFHELGHLLYHMGGVDFRDNRHIDFTSRKYSIYEVTCNKFANEFLVPTDVFKKQDLTVSENNISFLAGQFSVSRDVILRNLLDLGLIDSNKYDKMVSTWAHEYEQKKINKEQKKKKGGHYYYTQITYLGSTYINLAFSKYYQNKITPENLSSYLNIKESKISTFEHYAFG